MHMLLQQRLGLPGGSVRHLPVSTACKMPLNWVHEGIVLTQGLYLPTNY